MHPAEILRAFDEWEGRTRGMTAWPQRVPLEPPFSPLFPKERGCKPILDDGRRPGLFARLRAGGHEPAKIATAEPIETVATKLQREIVELELLLPRDFAVRTGAARSWLASLQSLTEPLSFELLGLPDRVAVRLVCGKADTASAIPRIAASRKNIAVYPHVVEIGVNCFDKKVADGTVAARDIKRRIVDGENGPLVSTEKVTGRVVYRRRHQ
jgi:hypothetical protein